jgi:hypothetical protein
MYIVNQERQASLIREMTQLRKDSKSWEVYYHHPSTNVMWKSYFPQATNDMRGPKILRTEPVPHSLKKRLWNCLNEPNPENAIGLGIELSTQPHRWQQIIVLLEQNYSTYNRKQLSHFIEHLGVEQYKSLFKDIGYCIDDGSISEKAFCQLARRSRIIRFKRFWML